jgi:hypothetical protein
MNYIWVKLITYVCLAQGLYFAVTGIWPLLSIRTFQMVTGRKTDLWLVKTVGVLVSVIGCVLIVTALRGNITLEISLLAVGSAAGLAGIDVMYVTKRRISPIYLLDALIEIALIATWLLGSINNQVR